jgi:hypothetical protein
MRMTRVSVSAAALVSALLFPLPWPGTARAAVINVPGDTSTIMSAISLAHDGDTINIGPGTYREWIVVIDKNNLTFVGSGRNSTIIDNPDPGSAPIYLRHAANITVRDLTAQRGSTGVAVLGREANVPNPPLIPSSLTLERVTLRDFDRVGIFVGSQGCAGLPPGSFAVPDCYLQNRQRYVDSSSLVMRDTILQNVGAEGQYYGTGIVFNPGTHGFIQNSSIVNTHMTGLFAWGSTVEIEGSTFDDNIEHGLEFRQYPSPKMRTGFILRANGILRNNVIKNSRPLPNGALGGGMVTQAADLVMTGNTIQNNAAWGISAVNYSNLVFEGNTWSGNPAANLTLAKYTTASLKGETLTGSRVNLIASNYVSVRMDECSVRGGTLAGIIFDKNSDGHLSKTSVSGVKAAGVIYKNGSWGSVTGSTISNNRGSGVENGGGPFDLFVEGNTITGNGGSGVLLWGPTAAASVRGNTFGANGGYDLACPGGSPVYMTGQTGQIDPACRSNAGQYLTVPALTDVIVPASTRFGSDRRFAGFVTASLPIIVGKTIAAAGASGGVTAGNDLAKTVYLPGGTTFDGAESTVLVYNPGPGAVTAVVTLVPEGGTPRTVKRFMLPGKRKPIAVSPLLGPDVRFAARIDATAPVTGELRLTRGGRMLSSMGATLPSETWYLPPAQNGSGHDTLISVYNPGSTAAAFSLTYYHGDTKVSSYQHSAPPLSQASIPATELPDHGEDHFAVRVTADQPVAAALVADDHEGLRGGGGVSRASATWYFPGVIVNDSAETKFVFVNPGTAPAVFSLTVHSGDGVNPGTGTQLPSLYSLSPGDMLTLDASALGALAPLQGRYGLAVNSDHPILAASSLENGAWGDASGDLGATATAYRWVYGDGMTASGGAAETFLHLYNPNEAPATVRLAPAYSRR